MTRPRRTVLPILVLLLVGIGSVLGAGTPVAASGMGGSGEPPRATAGDPLLFQPVKIAPNTTRMLQLDSLAESAIASRSVSVTNALQAETVAVEAALDRRATDRRFGGSGVNDERILSAAIDRIEARIEALAERERAARERFRTGKIGPEEYLATVGEVNREARALESTIEAYERLVDTYPSLQDRLAAARTEVVRYTGPLADEVGTAVVGGERTGESFVAVSENGMVLAAIQDGTYVREIMRTDARDEAVGGVDLDAAQNRIAELYPWAWKHKGDVSINTVGEDVFRFQLSYGHGVLNSLLDTSSGNVYREVQTKSLSSMPVVEGRSTTVNNTTLRVSEARVGAPLRIAVVNATGNPITATVTANGTTLGTTGTGPVWMLVPNEPFNVTADTGTRSLELAVHPKRADSRGA
ncbi:MAG: hypothetical protein ABEJ84_04485 [Halodesulfurarchaeum sp.]